MPTRLTRPRSLRSRYHDPRRITNWQDYNAALSQRGGLPVAGLRLHARRWKSTRRSGERGRPESFSDAWIAALLTLRLAFRLPWRQTAGLALAIAPKGVRVPHFGHLAKRAQRLGAASRLLARRRAVLLERAVRDARARGRPLTLLIDSTGLSIKGPGGWQTDKPGAKRGDPRRRKYHKLHAVVDAGTQEVLSYLTTDSLTGDPPAVPPLLEALPDDVAIEALAADGAYDARSVYGAAAARGAHHALIPPKPGAKPWKEATPGAALRNANLAVGTKDRDFVPGGAAWREAVGYGVRSLVETTFSRLSAMGGNRLRARSATGQAAEIHAALELLNEHARLGLPERVGRARSVLIARGLAA